MQDQKTVLQTAREITLAEICSTFIDEKLLSLSPMTKEWYRCRLGLFSIAIGPQRALSSVDKKDLIAWWNSLDDRARADPPELSWHTFHGYVRAARRLLRWMYDEHLITSELWKIIPLPKLPDPTNEGIDDNYVVQLIDLARDNVRDFAILHFLESTGARRGGVVTLRMKDISPNAPEPYCRQATVHEKGRKARKVVMTPEALDALRSWLAIRDSNTKFVFTSQRPGVDEGLEPGAINQIIARYQEQLDIQESVSPHKWRHRFGRARTKEGMPLGQVSKLMGHADVSTTVKYYAKCNIDELQEAYDRYYRPPKSS